MLLAKRFAGEIDYNLFKNIFLVNMIHDDPGILLQLISMFTLDLDDNYDVQVVVLMLIILSAYFPGRCVCLLIVITMSNKHLALQTNVWLSSGRSLPSRVTRSRQWHLLLGGEDLQTLTSF